MYYDPIIMLIYTYDTSQYNKTQENYFSKQQKPVLNKWELITSYWSNRGAAVAQWLYIGLQVNRPSDGSYILGMIHTSYNLG